MQVLRVTFRQVLRDMVSDQVMFRRTGEKPISCRKATTKWLPVNAPCNHDIVKVRCGTRPTPYPRNRYLCWGRARSTLQNRKGDIKRMTRILTSFSTDNATLCFADRFCAECKYIYIWSNWSDWSEVAKLGRKHADLNPPAREDRICRRYRHPFRKQAHCYAMLGNVLVIISPEDSFFLNDWFKFTKLRLFVAMVIC